MNTMKTILMIITILAMLLIGGTILALSMYSYHSQSFHAFSLVSVLLLLFGSIEMLIIWNHRHDNA
ncbi:hypothetical protein SAMN05216584_101329 [Selenomonas sp. WCT3]|nr:hypothetical protein SAMN05216584_101329 [Selenomonas ruminantium]